MSRPPYFRRTLRVTRARADVPRDVRDELALHLELTVDELVSEGWEPAEARAEARRRFGDLPTIEHDCVALGDQVSRRRRFRQALESVAADLRHGARDLRRHPGYVLTFCLTLATAMVLHTLVFAVAQTVVWRSLPFFEPERLVAVEARSSRIDGETAMASAYDFYDRRAGVPAFEEVAIYKNRTHSFGEPGAMVRAFSQLVSPSFFPLLGVEPLLGRTLSAAASEPGHPAEAVIGAGLWREAFGEDPDILGREIRIEGTPVQIVGVMPDSFVFPGWHTELWLPVTLAEQPGTPEAFDHGGFLMLARLAEGSGVEQARAQMASLDARRFDRLPAELRQVIEKGGWSSHAVPFHQQVVGEAGSWILLVWGGSLFVLAIAVISVCNLQWVHDTARLRALATRHVLGASTWRLLRQRATEGALLAAIGGGLGVLVGWRAIGLIRGFETWEIPRIEQLSLGTGEALGLWLACIFFVGLGSAASGLAVLRHDLFSMVRGGSATATRRHAVWRGAFVATQVAVAIVLLVGASLLVATLGNLASIDLGFEPAGVTAGALSLPGERYPGPAAQHAFYDRATAAIGALPGVRGVALASGIPFSGNTGKMVLTPASSTTPTSPSEEGPAAAGSSPREGRSYFVSTVSPEYFEVLGIPLLHGRSFEHTDDLESEPVVVVSQRLAESLWPGGQAVGRQVRLGKVPDPAAPPHTVIGVVGDIAHEAITEGAASDAALEQSLGSGVHHPGSFYRPLRQGWAGFTRLLVRADRPSEAVVRDARELIVGLDPELGIFWVTTLERSIASTLISRRVPMKVLGVFALLALAMAAVAIFGVLSHSVAVRSKEMGIRLALGSSRGQIYRRVLGTLALPVGVGLGVGILGALVASRLLESLVFGVGTADPRVLLLVSTVVSAVALVAAIWPAREAARVDPVEVLSAD